MVYKGVEIVLENFEGSYYSGYAIDRNNSGTHAEYNIVNNTICDLLFYEKEDLINVLKSKIDAYLN